jgi:predicted PurR-regulated permease PerM
MEQLESEYTEYRKNTGEVASEIWTATLTYVRSRIVVCLLVGVLTALGFWWVGVKYWWLWGALVGVTNVVPILPLVFGLLPALIAGYVQFQDLSHPIYLTLVFMAVQILDGFVLSPLIQGKMVGLHPITTFVLLMAGSFFLGFIGLIVAIPIAIALKIIFRNFFQPRSVNSPMNRPGSPKRIEVEEVRKSDE